MSFCWNSSKLNVGFGEDKGDTLKVLGDCRWQSAILESIKKTSLLRSKIEREDY